MCSSDLTIFLADDGRSGTNFDWPSWKKVIGMISPFPKKRTEKREKKRTGMSAPVKKIQEKAIERTKAKKEGSVQADRGRMAGGRWTRTRKRRYGLRQCPGNKDRWTGDFSRITLAYGDGTWKKLYCFLMILGYSRMWYIEFVTDMSTNTLIRCHQDSFRYFGGYPEEILYDITSNLSVRK